MHKWYARGCKRALQIDTWECVNANVVLKQPNLEPPWQRAYVCHGAHTASQGIDDEGQAGH